MLTHVFAATISVAAWPAANLPPDEIYDNACARQHARLMFPVAAFEGDPAAMAQFDAAVNDAAMAQGAIDQPVVRAWAETLLAREGLPTAGLRVVPMTQGGCRNAGLFALETSAGRYVAKRSYRMFEPLQWITLQMHLHCYPREMDVRDRNPHAVSFPGDELRRARIMPLVAWNYTQPEPGPPRVPPRVPVMLFERAHGTPLETPDPQRLDLYSAAEQEVFLRRARALGVSLALLQVPSLFGSSRAHVFERAAWKHDDLHLGNMFYDEASERIELVDCIDMRRSAGWDKDLRGLILHRDSYPVDDPLRQAWSRAVAEGYLSRTTGTLHDELRNAFAGTLIYTKTELLDPLKRAKIW